LAANAADADGTVTQVVFFVKDHMMFDSPVLQVGVDANAPFTAQAANLSPGHYLAFAQATDDKGATGYAFPAEFTIAQPPGTPELRARLETLNGGIRVLTLEWDDMMATLESSSKVTGPWSEVEGVVSPHSVNPNLGSQFFRLRLPSVGHLDH
jgi:hypothetical protein